MRRETVSHSGHSRASRAADVGQIFGEGGLGRDAFRFAAAVDPAAVLAAREFVEAAAQPAVSGQQFLFVHCLKLTDCPDAVARQFSAHGLADAPNDTDRLGGKKCLGLGPADDRKAARFVEVGRDLGQELVVAQPYRSGHAGLPLDAPDQPGQHYGRRRTVQPGRSGQVEKGLVDGNRFDRRGEILHHAADFPADRLVFRHIGPKSPRPQGRP